MLLSNRLLEISADNLIAASHAYTAAVDADSDRAVKQRCLAALEQAQRMHRTIIQLVEDGFAMGTETNEEVDRIANDVTAISTEDTQDIVGLWSDLIKYQNDWDACAIEVKKVEMARREATNAA